MRQLLLSVTALVMACSGYDPTGPHDSKGPEPVDLSAVASVMIGPEIPPLGVGSWLLLKVTLYDAAGRELTKRTVVFTSSDARVLSVDANGMVRTLAEGEAVVTATSEGRSGTMRIVVVDGGTCAGCWDSTTP